MKRRLEFRLDPELSKWLNDLAAKPGSSKSAIAEAALREYMERGGRAYVDPRIEARMNKLTAGVAQIARSQEVLLETMALYVEYDLGVTGRMLPDAERAEAHRIGRQRFAKFVEHVGQRIAGARSPSRELVDELELGLAVGDAEAEKSAGKKPN